MKVGRKGTAHDITLRFGSADFYHLAGLQYIKDMPQLRTRRDKVFDEVLAGRITHAQLAKSSQYSQMKPRLDALRYLQQFLDSHELTFRYNKKINPGSRIEADFILSNEIDERVAFLFIASVDEPGVYFCRSFFPMTDKDYTAGQPKYTLLYKEKKNISTGQSEILYNRGSGG
jgi:hypothetical protein